MSPEGPPCKVEFNPLLRPPPGPTARSTRHSSPTAECTVRYAVEPHRWVPEVRQVQPSQRRKRSRPPEPPAVVNTAFTDPSLKPRRCEDCVFVCVCVCVRVCVR